MLIDQTKYCGILFCEDRKCITSNTSYILDLVLSHLHCHLFHWPQIRFSLVIRCTGNFNTDRDYLNHCHTNTSVLLSSLRCLVTAANNVPYSAPRYTSPQAGDYLPAVSFPSVCRLKTLWTQALNVKCSPVIASAQAIDKTSLPTDILLLPVAIR